MAGFFISWIGFIKVRRTQPQTVNKLAISNCYYYPDIALPTLGCNERKYLNFKVDLGFFINYECFLIRN
jgi:hypothetical protein